MDTPPGVIRTSFDYAVGVGQAILLALLVPAAILAVGLPIVLLVRVVLNLFGAN